MFLTDKMKPVVLAKIAAQASDFYIEAARMTSNSTVKSMVDKVRGTPRGVAEQTLSQTLNQSSGLARVE